MARPKTKPCHGAGLSEETVRFTDGASDSNCAEIMRESLLRFLRTGDATLFTQREKSRLARIGFLAYSRGGPSKGYRLTEKALNCIGVTVVGTGAAGTVDGPAAALETQRRRQRRLT